MTTSANSTDKWHPKYLRRLAWVYLDRYDTLGYMEAKDWYRRTLTPELRQAVRPVIQEMLEERGAKKKS